jgi:hypothetical protein
MVLAPVVLHYIQVEASKIYLPISKSEFSDV